VFRRGDSLIVASITRCRRVAMMKVGMKHLKSRDTMIYSFSK
jgi:hypothetical protein